MNNQIHFTLIFLRKFFIYYWWLVRSSIKVMECHVGPYLEYIFYSVLNDVLDEKIPSIYWAFWKTDLTLKDLRVVLVCSMHILFSTVPTFFLWIVFCH